MKRKFHRPLFSSSSTASLSPAASIMWTTPAGQTSVDLVEFWVASMKMVYGPDSDLTGVS
ncbi:hypothetical protein GFS60_06721 (plasmid) [Rhodococcus sp. WAY2]|nr:hypothetical protein GFS60_06721 [Rhodococcus sp. WAY2]